MAISLVQGPKTSTATSLTLTSSTTAGNCLVVVFFNQGATGTSACTLGGAADNFTKAAEIKNTGLISIWVDPNCAGGQTAVAITATGTPSFSGMWAAEFSGLAPASIVDQTSTNSGTAASWTSNSTPTTTVANELWIGACEDGTSTPTGPSSPWNNTAITSSVEHYLAGYDIVSSTGAAVYSGTGGGSAGWEAAVVTLKGAATSGPAGTVQPIPTDPTPRRKRLRAVTGFTPVTTTNPSGPAGTVQPETAQPAPRRKPARAAVRFTPVPGGIFVNNALGSVQPATAKPAPRRKRARAWIQFTPVTTANASGVSGVVQPWATVPVPRRRRLRATSAGVAVPGIYGTAPAQQPYMPPRRRLSRAQVRFHPVPGGNAGRQLLIALAAQAGTDDYGNTYPQGIFATAGVIEGPEIIAFGAGGLYLAYSPTPAANNMISSVAGASGTDQYGNAFLAGTTSYTFDGTKYTALNMNGGVLTWYQAASESAGWVSQSSITFQGSDVASTATVNINSGATRLVGSASAVIPTFNPGITSLPHDNNAGSSWVSGERAFMNNNWVDNINSNFSTIITILRNVGIIG